ncbi:MAG TPA: short-chain dehydrogenase [Deltaproteobacteria bacterium]|nr:short-chain dehydrogenase [Deltaproteobacteria bacterium]
MSVTSYLDRFRLDDQIAYVAGGCGLLGRETAVALAEAGAKTVILDLADEQGRALSQSLRSAGHQADFAHFDITRLQRLEKDLVRLTDQHGLPQVWVNAAYPRTADWALPLEQGTAASLRKNVDLHLNAYAWLSRSVALLMKSGGIHGSIINFGSIYGVVGNDFTVYEGTSLTSPMAYSLIKGGIVNQVRYLASYFGKSGIRVNSICPGGIQAGQNSRFIKNYSRKVPLGRMGTPEDIAGAVLFLASPASCYITGATLMVDGGWTAI